MRWPRQPNVRTAPSIPVLLSCLVLLLPAAPGRAQPSSREDESKRFWRSIGYIIQTWGKPRHPDFSDPIGPHSENAAARYLSLFKATDDRLATLAGWHDARSDRLVVLENERGVTAAELEASLVAQADWIQQVIAASALDRFDLHLADDPGAVYATEDDPRRNFLTGTRAAARILRADAFRLWGQGQRSEATDRIAALIRLARHLATAPASSMQALVSASILNYGLDTLKNLAADGTALAPPQRRGLITALGSLDPEDPAGVHRCWLRDRQAMAAFMRSQLKGEVIGFRLQKLLVETGAIREMTEGLFGDILAGKDVGAAMRLVLRERFGIAWRAAERTDALDAGAILAALDRADELAKRADRAWNTPNAEQDLGEVQEAIEEDPTQIIALVLSYPRGVHRTWRQSVDRVQRALDVLNDPAVSK